MQWTELVSGESRRSQDYQKEGVGGMGVNIVERKPKRPCSLNVLFKLLPALEKARGQDKNRKTESQVWGQ